MSKKLIEIKSSVVREATLAERFEAICNDYIRAFQAKHDVIFEGWVGDKVGEWACFGENAFLLDNIRYDIDNNLAPFWIYNYYEFTSDPKNSINFETYIRMEKSGG
jgi:hypothetical protein